MTTMQRVKRKRVRSKRSSSRQSHSKGAKQSLRTWFYSVLEPLAYLFTLIFIFTIPFEKMLEIDGIGTISRLVGLPLLGGWGLVLLVKHNFRRFSAFHWFSLLYVAICGLSYFWSLSAEGTEIMFGTYVQLYLVSLFIWFGLNSEKRCVQAFMV